jgi:hypothetical protein
MIAALPSKASDEASEARVDGVFGRDFTHNLGGDQTVRVGAASVHVGGFDCTVRYRVSDTSSGT